MSQSSQNQLPNSFKLKHKCTRFVCTFFGQKKLTTTFILFRLPIFCSKNRGIKNRGDNIRFYTNQITQKISLRRKVSVKFSVKIKNFIYEESNGFVFFFFKTKFVFVEEPNSGEFSFCNPSNNNLFLNSFPTPIFGQKKSGYLKSE